MRLYDFRFDKNYIAYVGYDEDGETYIIMPNNITFLQMSVGSITISISGNFEVSFAEFNEATKALSKYQKLQWKHTKSD